MNTSNCNSSKILVKFWLFSLRITENRSGRVISKPFFFNCIIGLIISLKMLHKMVAELVALIFPVKISPSFQLI